MHSSAKEQGDNLVTTSCLAASSLAAVGPSIPCGPLLKACVHPEDAMAQAQSKRTLSIFACFNSCRGLQEQEANEGSASALPQEGPQSSNAQQGASRRWLWHEVAAVNPGMPSSGVQPWQAAPYVSASSSMHSSPPEALQPHSAAPEASADWQHTSNFQSFGGPTSSSEPHKEPSPPGNSLKEAGQPVSDHSAAPNCRQLHPCQACDDPRMNPDQPASSSHTASHEQSAEWSQAWREKMHRTALRCRAITEDLGKVAASTFAPNLDQSSSPACRMLASDLRPELQHLQGQPAHDLQPNDSHAKGFFHQNAAHRQLEQPADGKADYFRCADRAPSGRIPAWRAPVILQAEQAEPCMQPSGGRRHHSRQLPSISTVGLPFDDAKGSNWTDSLQHRLGSGVLMDLVQLPFARHSKPSGIAAW